MDKLNITIIPGSYKPPHKGHLSLIEKLIKLKDNSKIIIVISKKSRPLDNRFLYMNNSSKIELQNALIEYLPHEKNEIVLLSKTDLIKKINNLIKSGFLKSIDYNQSIKIWNIYLKYLKKKYKNIPQIIFIESDNIIKETTKIVLQILREDKPKMILLMKSEKNKENKRFQFIDNRFSKYVKTILFPNIKDIDATGMRLAILQNDKIKFSKYLPSDLTTYNINKIWNIVNCKL